MEISTKILQAFGLQGFTRNLLIASFLISLSVFNFGFDNTAYSTIQAQDPFIRRFGTCDDQNKCSISTRNISFLNSLPRLPFAVGIVAGNLIGERFGRRIVVLVMVSIAIVSSIVSVTSKTYGQILAGRMLCYCYSGMEGWLVPMFQAEIVPARNRGALVVTYTFNHIFGSFILACITYRTSTWDTDLSWKLPIALGLVCPGIVLLCIGFIPESPRWLLRKGRDAEAMKQMHYIYAANPSYSPEEELELLKVSLAEERKRDGQSSWGALFKGVNRRRTTISIVTQFLNQATGQVFVSQYGTIFVKSLHTINPFLFTLINSAISCIGPLATILLVDRMGRRRMYLIFGSVSCVSVLLVGVLGCLKTSSQVKTGIVALDVLYYLFYIMSFGPIGALSSAEMPALQLRDKTANIGWNVQNLTNFVVAFTLPYLLNAGYANLQSKLGFIYGGICVFGLIWAYFCLPEVTGLSLEAIDELFEEKVAARKSRGWTSANPDSVGSRITRMEDNATHTQGVAEVSERKKPSEYEENAVSSTVP